VHSPIAIVFIHSGDSDYLRYSLAQARRSNPKSSIYLIGDETTAGKYADAEHVLYRDYVAAARAFASVYRHMNTNGHSFELFCLMRWFILRDFMRLRGIRSAVYIDSDIMLYEEMHYEGFRLYDFDLAVTGVVPPVLINNPAALEAFCSFIEESYTDNGRLAILEDRFRSMQAAGSPGGICDMTFWEMFIASGQYTISDLSMESGDAIYDRNIFLTDGFEMHNGIKRVAWHEGRPYGSREGSLVPIRFKGLHFQGPAKEIMGHFVFPPVSPADRRR
jgi:hypothetical protein